VAIGVAVGVGAGSVMDYFAHNAGEFSLNRLSWTDPSTWVAHQGYFTWAGMVLNIILAVAIGATEVGLRGTWHLHEVLFCIAFAGCVVGVAVSLVWAVIVGLGQHPDTTLLAQLSRWGVGAAMGGAVVILCGWRQHWYVDSGRESLVTMMKNW
jgi:hypothetical protein